MYRFSKLLIIAGSTLLLAVFVSFQPSLAAIYGGTEAEGNQAFGVCLDAPANPNDDPKFFVDHPECVGVKCEAPKNADEIAKCTSEVEAGTGLAKTTLSTTGITHTDNLGDYVKKLVNFSLPYLVLAAFVGYVVAGFMYVTAFGNDQMLEKAKKILIWVTIGLVLVILSYAITNLLTGELVKGLAG